MHPIHSKIKYIQLLILLIFFIPIHVLSQTIDPYKNIQYFELNNGLKVYMLADKQSINTKIELEVKVGTDIETEGTAGISHLLEHLIFRDKRIPHRDYLDYIKEEGATNINGYTGRYTSSYEATIDSNKSYWIMQTFAQMVFDKVVDIEDLEIEKKALQVEIGEFQWYHPLGHLISTIFKSIGKTFPDSEDIYQNEFGLTKPKELPSSFYSRKNNAHFTLSAVLAHYETYYYPKNMTLKIVGNFNAAKMKTLIKKAFGNIKKTGSKSAIEPLYNATLNNKPHYTYVTGEWDQDYAYIGSKYILDDYKKYLIIDAYTEYLASNMQKLLRNKLGQTYSVSPFYQSRQNAILAGVGFSSLHQDFEKSITLVRKKIAEDIVTIDTKESKEALKQAALYYSSVEHDSDTLFNLVGAQEYMHTYHKIYDKTPYDIFTSISKEDYQTTISKNFAQENTYIYIYNDYYLFPYDSTFLGFILIFLLFFLFVKSYKLIHRKKGIKFYTKRDILWRRRVTNRFFVFLKFTFIFILAMFFSEWSEFYFYSLVMNNPYYTNSIIQPYNYLISIMSFLWYLIIFLFINHYIFSKAFSRLDMTENSLNFIGGSWHEIKKEDIISIETIPWSIDKMKKTFGSSLLFFKPLVTITTTNKETIYIRAYNAQHLKEDLQKWKK